MVKRLLSLVSIVLIFHAVASAQGSQQTYPQDYFRSPLEIPISLSGGFGECRPNHFHTGLDMKTNQRENLRVLAAAEGYVSRVSISHTGYGNCLYITHPNGYTTVYGHLNDFFPELQQYVKNKQYELERWAVNLTLPPQLFPVRKGQFVAFSGNTGGSAGPHLHFEIRNTETEKVLNGFLFGLPIKDTKPPQAKQLAVYDGTRSVYEQEPKRLALRQTGRKVTIQPSLLSVAEPVVFFGVHAQDFTDNSNNWLGIYQMRLFVDGELQLATKLDELDFAQNRYMNAYADFKTKERTGNWFQGLYRLPNNDLSIYESKSHRGLIDLGDRAVHQVRIELADPYGNTSILEFPIQYDGSKPVQKQCAGLEARAKSGVSLETRTIRFFGGSSAFYDDFCLEYTEEETPNVWSNTFQIHSTAVPIHDFCDLSLKVNKPLPFELRSKLVFVHHVKPASLPGNNPQKGMAVQYQNGWAQAAVRTFGNYYVDVDTVGPTITPLQQGTDFSNASSIRFRVEDDKTSVTLFRAELDGSWLRFVRRGDLYTYEFDERCPKGDHQLTIVAEDESQNQRVFTMNFKR